MLLFIKAFAVACWSGLISHIIPYSIKNSNMEGSTVWFITVFMEALIIYLALHSNWYFFQIHELECIIITVISNVGS